MKWYEIDAVDRLYARTWGDGIHFGHYTRQDEPVTVTTRRAKRHLARAAQIKPASEVLEVASGWGATARFLAEAIECCVTATNYSDRQARIAAEKCQHFVQTGRIRLAMADYHALPFRDEAFDVHWSQESLVHAQDKAKVFAEAFRVLKPGGRMVFTDQTTHRDRLDPQARARIAERHGSDDLWSDADFLCALRHAGFTIRQCADWTSHMARHFTRLYRTIDEDRPSLEADIGAEILNQNHAMWRWGAELARNGGIGYVMIVAEKPDG